MKKVISLFLVLTVLCLSLLCLPITGSAATTNQNNIVGWADYYYDITWTALKTIDGWHSSSSSYTFTKGSTYRIPYAQPINSGAYIGYGVTVAKFLEAANNVNSVFYTKTSSYNNTYSAFYGMDCSAFVSSCWGAKRTTTYYIPTISNNLGDVNDANIDQLALGDALNSRSVGHVVLITDIEYANGKISKVEVTEETPPQLKRTVYTRASLISKYSKYTIQRYTGSVPAPPVQQPETQAPTQKPTQAPTQKPTQAPTQKPTQKPTQAPATDPPRLLGDADGDGEVSILDVTAIQRRDVLIALPFFDETAADTDCDDVVTIIDATWIQRSLAGVNIPYPIGEPIA